MLHTLRKCFGNSNRKKTRDSLGNSSGKRLACEHSLFDEIRRICKREAIAFRVDSSDDGLELHLTKGCYCQNISVPLTGHATSNIYARNKEIICKLHNFVFNYKQELRSV